ncbi:hypothetical protein [Streptomyces sp. NPDC056817]|uniref:hypothetical protein n=1 Tax=Streptomyces sp. NPDC056817 TaxID=3345950 RepID=UPI0036C6977C
MLYAFLLSLVRTFGPVVAGWLITQALRLGVPLDGPRLVSLMTAGFAIAYYAVFRLAEMHISRRFGWLLGWAAPPEYKSPQG